MVILNKQIPANIQKIVTAYLRDILKEKIKCIPTSISALFSLFYYIGDCFTLLPSNQQVSISVDFTEVSGIDDPIANYYNYNTICFMNNVINISAMAINTSYEWIMVLTAATPNNNDDQNLQEAFAIGFMYDETILKDDTINLDDSLTNQRQFLFGVRAKDTAWSTRCFDGWRWNRIERRSWDCAPSQRIKLKLFKDTDGNIRIYLLYINSEQSDNVMIETNALESFKIILDSDISEPMILGDVTNEYVFKMQPKPIKVVTRTPHKYSTVRLEYFQCKNNLSD